MSEYEFLKLNPQLKIYYNMFEKHFAKTPKNNYKISKTLNIQNITEILKLPLIMFTVENENYEVKSILSLKNDDKIKLSINKKFYLLEIINHSKMKYLKNLEYNLSVYRNSAKVKNCKIEMKMQNLGNISFIITENIIKNKKEKKEEKEISFEENLGLSPYLEKPELKKENYILKSIYSNKFYNLIDAKILINSNEKEYNNLELKSKCKIFNTNFQFYNFNLISFNIMSIHKHISFTKNIIGISNKSYLTNRLEDLNKKKLNENYIESAFGITLQNLKPASINLCIFTTNYINKIEFKHGFNIYYIFFKNSVQPTYVTQLSTLDHSLVGKLKISKNFLRLHQELNLKNILHKLTEREIGRVSLHLNLNLEKYNKDLSVSKDTLKTSFKCNYGFSLNIN